MPKLVLPDDEAKAWQLASQSSQDVILDDFEDDIYAQLPWTCDR